MRANMNFLSHLAQFLLEWRMLQTKLVEKIKTPTLVSVIFFFFETRAVYEIKWKTIVQPDRQQMTIWRMRIARWITKATNTHT